MIGGEGFAYTTRAKLRTADRHREGSLPSRKLLSTGSGSTGWGAATEPSNRRRTSTGGPGADAVGGAWTSASGRSSLGPGVEAGGLWRGSTEATAKPIVRSSAEA